MPEVIYEKRGKIAYVTLNRPEAVNALNLQMHQQLWEVWEDFDADDSLQLAIITGAGVDVFCAGADLKSHVPMWFENNRAGYPRDKLKDGIGTITRGLHRIYKPIIGAINGCAVAGGLEIALACDIRIACDKAMFGSFEVRRGYHHDDGGIVRMVNICGAGIALGMNLTGEAIDAQRALQCNLVSRVVAQDKSLETAEAMAAIIGRCQAGTNIARIFTTPVGWISLSLSPQR